jgi:putative mRNA 3-end processing factor
MPRLIEATDSGLYCEEGDFHIDAWKTVERNLITHAHSDHARRVAKRYLCSREGETILRERLGNDCSIASVDFRESIDINGVKVSFHPAGHVRGSAQIRVEHKGEVFVVSGDYKRQPDRTCSQFEVVRCNSFITESTFGLPIYRWRPTDLVLAEINAWWARNASEGITSIIYAYSLGKAQRILSGLDPSIGTILLHGAMLKLTELYRAGGVDLPPTLHASSENSKAHKGKAIVIAPSSADGSPWVRKFAPYSSAAASGWMQIRGFRRRGAIDRGFVLSDHVDWPDLLRTIEETGAEHVGITHGYTTAVCRYLREMGKNAYTVKTHFEVDDELPTRPPDIDERAQAGDNGEMFPASEGPG